MSMIIDNVDFEELEAEKYWSFAKTYKGNKKEETKNMILSCEYIGAEKLDGHYCRFIKDMDGNMRVQGRTESVNGGYLNKIEWIPQCQKFFDFLPNGTCLLGELYFPNQRGSRKVTTILGCLKEKALERQNKGEKLHIYIFDVWAYNGKSYLQNTIEDRVAVINSIKDKYITTNDYVAAFEYVDFAEYLEGQELWSALGSILSRGGEGIVITKKGSHPEPGKRTARKTLKVKMEIEQNIDAFLTGNYKPATRLYKGKDMVSWIYWENIRTGEKVAECKYEEYRNGGPFEPITRAYYHGWASSVEFGVFKDGEITPIGWISGIPDSLKKEIVENPAIQGRVAEITCMEIENIDEQYSLRHGKIVNWREDKSAKDCSFSQIADK